MVPSLYIPIDDLYSHRVQFRGRTGGQNMDVDLDNLSGDFQAALPENVEQRFDGPGGTPMET